MKKFLLRLLLVVILLPVVGIAWEYGKSIYYRDQFRFEHFDTADELLAYLNKHFPQKSDGMKLIEALKKAGARCRMIRKGHYPPNTPKNCEYIAECRYNTGFISLYPLNNYTVEIYVDEHYSILEINTNKTEGFY